MFEHVLEGSGEVLKQCRTVVGVVVERDGLVEDREIAGFSDVRRRALDQP